MSFNALGSNLNETEIKEILSLFYNQMPTKAAKKYMLLISNGM